MKFCGYATKGVPGRGLRPPAKQDAAACNQRIFGLLAKTAGAAVGAVNANSVHRNDWISVAYRHRCSKKTAGSLRSGNLPDCRIQRLDRYLTASGSCSSRRNPCPVEEGSWAGIEDR